MRANEFANSPIDHYIQAEIVSQLYKQTERSFSELKSDDVENSLFMYHMRKLINRGVVEKSNDGFKLTAKGIHWVNFIGPSTLQPKILPRLLMNFIITNNDKSQVLLSRRKGPASEILNEFLLPGGLYPYGMPEQQALTYIKEEMNLPTTLVLKYETLLEKLIHTTDGFVHHSFSTVYSSFLDREDPYETEHFSLQWYPIEDIASDTTGSIDRSLKLILQKFLAHSMPPRIICEDALKA